MAGYGLNVDPVAGQALADRLTDASEIDVDTITSFTLDSTDSGGDLGGPHCSLGDTSTSTQSTICGCF